MMNDERGKVFIVHHSLFIVPSWCVTFPSPAHLVVQPFGRNLAKHLPSNIIAADQYVAL
jgi:hypothetical protein